MSSSKSGSIAPVAILMGTYNGERFLSDQLTSIAAQTYPYWELHVSDDGSTDRTLNIIHDLQTKLTGHTISVTKGPGRGFVSNFLTLACSPDIRASYYAFADQDDIWAPSKLEHALDWLKTIPPERPALYCSRTQLIDEGGKNLGYSPLFRRKPSFQNALVQSIAGANTMVFNEAARQLLAASGPKTHVVSHDWWLYMLTTGCGGITHYDTTPSISYRQHGKNLVGANTGVNARYRRLLASLQGRFVDWNNVNLQALEKTSPLLTTDNREVLKNFILLRAKKSSFARVTAILNSGIYRQTFVGNMSLFAGAWIGKI